jgi:hypothetical protein
MLEVISEALHNRLCSVKMVYECQSEMDEDEEFMRVKNLYRSLESDLS